DVLEKAGREGAMIEALFDLAALRRDHKDFDAAEAALLKIVAEKPRDERAHGRLREVYQAASDSPGEVHELLRFAEECAKAGDRDEAVSKLEIALTLDRSNTQVVDRLCAHYADAAEPEQAAAHLLTLAETVRSAGEVQLEEKILLRVVDADPMQPHARLRIKDLLLQSQRRDEAADWLIDYAGHLLKNDETKSAAAAYDDALTIRPGDRQALAALKDLAEARGDAKAAVGYLDQLADAAKKAGESDAVIELLREAVKLDPIGLGYWTRLRDALKASGDEKAALAVCFEAIDATGDALTGPEKIDWLDEALALAPGDERTLTALRDAYREAGEDERAAETAVRLATQLEADNRLDDAVDAWRQVARIAPDHHDARRHLAQLHKAQGDEETAAAEYFALADKLVETGDTAGAREALEAAMALDGQKARALKKLKDLLAKAGDAEAALNVALSQARTAAEDGDPAQAQRHYREILAQQDRRDVRDELVAVLVKDDKADEAIIELFVMADADAGDPDAQLASLRRVLAIDPANAKAHKRVLKALEGGEDAAAYREALDAAIDAHRESGHLGELEMLLRKRLALDSEDEAALGELAEVYAQRGEVDKASLLLFGRAERAMDAGDAASATEIFERIVRLDPDNEEARRRLTQIYREAGRKDDAVGQLVALVELCLRLQRTGAARQYLQEAKELAPKHKRVKALDRQFTAESTTRVEDLLSRADEAMADGRMDEAGDMLVEARAMDPDNTEVQVRLSRLGGIDAEAHQEAGEFFEDVVVPFSEQEDVDIAWGEMDEADLPEITTFEAPGETSPLDEAEPADDGEVDLFGGMIPDESPTEPEAAASDDGEADLFGAAEDDETGEADLFGEAPEEEESPAVEDLEETMVKAVEEAAEPGDVEDGDADLFAEPEDEGADLFAEAEPETEPEPEDEGEIFSFESPGEVEADLFAEADETEDEPDIAAAPAAETSDEGVDLFDAAEDEAAGTERVTPYVDAGDTDVPEMELDDEAGELTEAPDDDEGEDLFGEALEGDAEADVDVFTHDDQPPAVEIIETDAGSSGESVTISDDDLGDLLKDLTGEVAAAKIQGTGDFLQDMSAEFKSMLGEEAMQDSETHFSLGIAYREMEQTHDAITEFQKALALGDPVREADTAYQLAQCFMDLERWDEAAVYLDTALAAEPSETWDETMRLDVLMDLGEAYQNMGELKRALRVFQEVDEANANYRGVQNDIASLKEKLGDEADDNISFI
ncbi:tetratricopeptide repeat protein, partial [bacterium]|nr:tetratricopeptide repeat protein [bacterium]